MRSKRALVLSCALILIAYVFFAVGTNRAMTVIVENKETRPLRRIIIDAGHGGEDGGATSCSGVLECEINLEIAKRLNDLLNFLGYQTIMIRTDDAAVHTEGYTIAQRKVSDLKNRVQLVNETENALLLSIHQNYFSDSRYSGAQVFYAKTVGSCRLAEMMQTSFRSTINPGSSRIEKSAQNIYLMDKINCDGVLIECGFLSNYHEESLLRNAEYQKKLCAVIATSVSTYLQENTVLT